VLPLASITLAGTSKRAGRRSNAAPRFLRLALSVGGRG
jgi:hypothetical protein